MTQLDIRWPEQLDRRFEPVESLGSTRRADMIRADDGETGRDVILEVVHSHLVEQEPIRRRIRRELAAVRRLDDPAVIDVYDLIEDGDVVALVKEYVDGPTVRQRVEQQGPMDWEEVRPIVDDILDAVGDAHRKGIWHRDLNAEQVVIDGNGRGRVGGFGVARVEELVALTMHTRVLGALEAMAPERVLGMDYDGRADLYSVGAVAYELLIGHPPVDGGMGGAFFSAQRGGGPADDVPEDIPRDARYVLERSLAADMGTRFATADQMQRALYGAYDEEMWRGWASRNTEYCPDCQSPIIDGLARCIVCGYQFRRLVQEPGEGPWMVRIVSPYEDFEPRTWFDSNTESKYLSDEQVTALMELLDSHKDTEAWADGDWEYRWPPYVLLSDLTEDDARRVRDKLDARSIPHELRRELPGIWHNTRNGNSRKNGVMVAIGLMLITGFLTVHVDVPVPDPLAIGGFLAFVLALVASQVLLVPLKRRLGSRRDIERKKGHAFMIPTEELRGQTTVAETVVLPERTGAVLEGLEDDGIRREVHELLVLAVAVAREDGRRAGMVADIVEEVLELAVAADEVTQAVGQQHTVELFDRLRRLEVRQKDCETTDGADNFDEKHRRVLERMEEHDRNVGEATTLRARLVAVRGALLDIRADIGDVDDNVVLDFAVDSEVRLTELKTYLEAGVEVEEAMSQGSSGR